MSKHVAVAEAVKALVKLALPVSTVRGMDLDEAKPLSIGELGQAIVRSGDPGEPEIDLSPPTYWFDRSFPIELASYDTPATTAQASLGAMATAIGAAIAADRYLGGLVTWLDATAPADGEMDLRGAKPIGWSDFAIIATYSTTSPLG